MPKGETCFTAHCILHTTQHITQAILLKVHEYNLSSINKLGNWKRSEGSECGFVDNTLKNSPFMIRRPKLARKSIGESFRRCTTDNETKWIGSIFSIPFCTNRGKKVAYRELEEDSAHDNEETTPGEGTHTTGNAECHEAGTHSRTANCQAHC